MKHEGAPPNKRLKLTGGARFKGSGVLCPWRGTDCGPMALRRRAGRPQLKRDPLGRSSDRDNGSPMEVRMLAALVAALSVTVAGSPQGDQFLVDLEHGRIGAVSPRDSVRQLRAKFGANNVIRTVGRLEGSADTTFVVTIAGHKVVRHWN